jgi:hypothetical protein
MRVLRIKSLRLARLQAETAAELAALLPAILDRAWTLSLPARSGCALFASHKSSRTFPTRSAQRRIVNKYQ